MSAPDSAGRTCMCMETGVSESSHNIATATAQTGKYKCKYCGIELPTVWDLAGHVNKIHTGKEIPPVEKFVEHPCFKCDQLRILSVMKNYNVYLYPHCREHNEIVLDRCDIYPGVDVV